MRATKKIKDVQAIDSRAALLTTGWSSMALRCFESTSRKVGGQFTFIAAHLPLRQRLEVSKPVYVSLLYALGNDQAIITVVGW